MMTWLDTWGCLLDQNDYWYDAQPLITCLRIFFPPPLLLKYSPSACCFGGFPVLFPSLSFPAGVGSHFAGLYWSGLLSRNGMGLWMGVWRGAEHLVKWLLVLWASYLLRSCGLSLGIRNRTVHVPSASLYKCATWSNLGIWTTNCPQLLCCVPLPRIFPGGAGCLGACCPGREWDSVGGVGSRELG